MNNNVAFTICSKSYLGIANTLRDSFLLHNKSFDFWIVVADEEVDTSTNDLSAKTVLDVSNDCYYDMAFKYSITEFCTSIKPFAFRYFMHQGYELVIYLDPDILVFSKFDEVEKRKASVYLTPHITEMTPNIDNYWKQTSFLQYGVFNCGFIALRNDEIGLKVSEWWKEKLVNYSFSDSEKGVYTDQKWIDLLCSFIELDKIYVIKNLGYDLAPWNYSERIVYQEEEKYIVKDREHETQEYVLCFAHYSGINYKKLVYNNEIVSGDNPLIIPEDIKVLLYEYGSNLKEHDIEKYMSSVYRFDYFENGVKISKFNRRIYRALIEAGYFFDNPFSAKEGTLYELFCKKKMLSNRDSSTLEREKVSSFSKKNRFLCWCMQRIYTLLGVDKYVLLLRALHSISRYENGLFLFEKKDLNNYIRDGL